VVLEEAGPTLHKTPQKKQNIFWNLVGLEIAFGRGMPDTPQNQKKQKPQKHFLELSGPRNWLWQRPARNYTKPKNQKTQKPKKQFFRT
jgi:hypothetical protein